MAAGQRPDRSIINVREKCRKMSQSAMKIVVPNGTNGRSGPCVPLLVVPEPNSDPGTMFALMSTTNSK